MFGIFKNKKDKNDAFSLLTRHYEAADSLFVDFVQDEVNNNGRETNTIKIRTSASALVAAIYFTRRVPIKNGEVLASQKSKDTLLEIVPFFDYISSSLWSYLGNQGHFDMSETTLDEFSSKLFQLQQQKLLKYSESIVRMIDSGNRNSFGHDLTANITRDLFGEEVNDLMFRVVIVDLMGFK